MALVAVQCLYNQLENVRLLKVKQIVL